MINKPKSESSSNKEEGNAYLNLEEENEEEAVVNLKTAEQDEVSIYTAAVLRKVPKRRYFSFAGSLLRQQI